MNISKVLLKSFGWKLVNKIEEKLPKKAIVVAAPHTSNWDFVLGLLCFRGLGVKASFLIKKELFFFPMSLLLRSLGGIPVDRNKKNNVVRDVLKEFKERDELYLTITPEGTRKPVKRWKDGYHRIAKAAEVPVVLSYIDAKFKEVGVLKIYELQGDAKYDTLEIQKLYKNVTAIHPEKFILPFEVNE